MKTKVTIDRSKWRCGQDSAESAGKGLTMLLNAEGYMCCLGFVTRVVYPDLHIQNVFYPMQLGCIVPGLSEKCERSYFYTNNLRDTGLAERAALINDSKTLTRKQREEQLLELFKDSLYELEFVGDYEAEL